MNVLFVTSICNWVFVFIKRQFGISMVTNCDRFVKFNDYIDVIYPEELEIKDTTDAPKLMS